ncbi:3-deoxy-manno-octulosonate cytidylyltransferase [Sulfurospirillum arcachonense]|uniref:3-deoxy-manno-octulosonate cytidylyltransferase n=1 Tax=Sulfurospirillum arcachonense TaxID=57666 RepID=UPI0004687014|nr:3-deoxy-manno-octulosonate cytidylyltransferase [Sulfurospirillum arcachonense]
MIIIPARMASNRFPNKILADINGLPMVIATAKRVHELDTVVIATDSQEVIDLAKEYGYKAVMTGTNHQSGTDRINEAASKLDIDENEVIVNVQADEPFIEPEVVQKVIDRVKNSDAMMVSCYKLIDKTFANDPNHVKVINDANENAIYFSRSKIPYDREEHLEYFGHLGIYGFTKKSLKEFCALSPAPLENIEKLEQLRAIYYGKKIAMVRVESESFGIDTAEDLKKALDYFKEK